MLAICTTGNAENAVELRQVEVPKLDPTDILVKVVAAAQNPVDCKHVLLAKYMKKLLIKFSPGKRSEQQTEVTIVGFDYAGIVTRIGESVTQDVKAGDRIAGIVFGCTFHTLSSGPHSVFIQILSQVWR